MGSYFGSSPLARGLRAPSFAPSSRNGIIPARAGVYVHGLRTRSASSGSSPLARGLHCGPGGADAGGRIIPARAGFTLVRLLTCALDGDHPRSRGVYDHPQTRLLRRDGSSPLARGLRSPVKLKAEFIRIIPARAGFTRAGDCSGAQCRDHPRSRGVYAAFTHHQTVDQGSSPLARGLLEGVRACEVDQGIIPARAGFTSNIGPQ